MRLRPHLALLLTWLALNALACARDFERPPEPVSPLDERRLGRCAAPERPLSRGDAEPTPDQELDPAPMSTLRAAREERLRQGPLLEAWRPLLLSLKRPIEPKRGAWRSPSELNLDVEGLWMSADLMISLGVPLAETLRPLLRRDLDSLRALSWLKAAPELSPLATLTLDPEAEVDAWRQSGWSPLRAGSVGLVLEEQRLLYIRGTGEGVRLVQEVVRVNNKRGVEELGEVALPVNASLLNLYTLKPNGARRAPIVIPEKDSYSLQDLQPGDMIIARYLEPLSSLRRAGGVLTPRLPVHDPSRAVWRRLYHVWRLGSGPLMTYQHHAHYPSRQGNSPEVSIEERPFEGGRLVSVSIFKALPRAIEPGGLSVHEAPHIQISEPVSAEREWGEVLAQLRGVAPLSLDELKALRSWALSVSQLGVRVWQAIKEERPLLESRAPLESIQTGQGSRALTLWASLSALGERCALWIARPPEVSEVSLWRSPAPLTPSPSGAPPLDEIDPSLSLSHFEHVLVGCESASGGPPVWYDPALYLSPRGVISASLMGGEARALWPPPLGARCERLEGTSPRSWALARAPLPWAENPQEKHTLAVSLWLDPEGERGLLGARVLYGHAEHALSGEEGALLYERLSRASLEERVGWLERQWGGWLGATAVTGLRFAWTEAGGLALAYDLKLTLRLPARLSIAPQGWGGRFASLAQRSETLVLPPIEQRVQLTLLSSAPEGGELKGGDVRWALSLSGSDIEERWPEGDAQKATFQRHVNRSEATLSWRSRGGLVSPDRYPEWARFARAVSAHEQALRLTLIERR